MLNEDEFEIFVEQLYGFHDDFAEYQTEDEEDEDFEDDYSEDYEEDF